MAGCYRAVTVLIVALFSSWRRRLRHAPVVVSVAIICMLVTTFVIVKLTDADHPGHSGKDYVDITTGTLVDWWEYLVFMNPRRALWEHTDQMLGVLDIKPSRELGSV